MITDLTKLSRNNIVDLLKANGYNDNDDIESVEFVSAANSQVKYAISYYDYEHDVLVSDGFVFVYINNQGKLVAEY